VLPSITLPRTGSKKNLVPKYIKSMKRTVWNTNCMSLWILKGKFFSTKEKTEGFDRM